MFLKSGGTLKLALLTSVGLSVYLSSLPLLDLSLGPCWQWHKSARCCEKMEPAVEVRNVLGTLKDPHRRHAGLWSRLLLKLLLK